MQIMIAGRHALRGFLLGSWMITLLWWERKHALRHQNDSKLKRDLRNLAIAAGAGITTQLLEFPVAFYLARQAGKNRRGLLRLVPLPSAARTIVAIILLDYTLYWWHFLAHRVPLLWRFHQAHHLDREMDVTTGIRFHFGEIAISVLFRAAQVFALGPTVRDMMAWQFFLFTCILFHHANIQLPGALEHRLAKFVVTPRLHGIHHSIQPTEVNSNWSSGLTIWDWLHGTLLTDIPQKAIVIGLAEHLRDSDQALLNALTIPFCDPAPVPPMPYEVRRQRIAALH